MVPNTVLYGNMNFKSVFLMLTQVCLERIKVQIEPGPFNYVHGILATAIRKMDMCDSIFSDSEMSMG